MSVENLKALSRLAALISEGYPFAALQSKIRQQRLDVIAPIGAHSTLVEVFNQMRIDAALVPVQLVVLATGREAEDTAAALRHLSPEAEILEFPSWETLPHERLSPSPETVGARLKVLHRLQELQELIQKKKLNHPVFILASVRAVLQPVVDGLNKFPPLLLERGKDYLLFELSLKLVELAYQRVDMVAKRGEFAVRGGILDIFPTTAEHALRLEFFGDELEDIRLFNVADQRTIPTQESDQPLNSAVIYAAREIIITPSVASRAREMMHEFPNISTMLAKIAEGIPVEGMESLAPVLPKYRPLSGCCGSGLQSIGSVIRPGVAGVTIPSGRRSGKCWSGVGSTRAPKTLQSPPHCGGGQAGRFARSSVLPPLGGPALWPIPGLACSSAQ